MPISNEMVERATAAYMKETGAEQHQLDGWFEPAIRAALESALSAAEPIRWTWEERRFSESDIWDDMYDDEPPAPHKHVRNIRPLYAAPPAPSVAVKAIEAVWKYSLVIESSVRRGDGPEQYAGVTEALRLVKEARSALSAQVQDVATHRHKKRGTEYVLISVGKMQVDNWCEFTTEVNHAEGREYAFAGKAVDMREVAIYRSVDDGSLWVRPVEEFNDGRFEPLPAAPAKQEG